MRTACGARGYTTMWGVESHYSDTLLESMSAIGYRIVDEWEIDSLSHEISSHPELGRSQSAGFYMTLEP
jgi:hypothetical protein